MNGAFAVLSVAADSSPKSWDDFKAEYMDKIQMPSSVVHMKMLGLHDIEVDPPKLTRRETECLYWTSHGKTCADVADILDIAENTARFYLASARNKLNCQTISHCVAKAISLRIIPPVT